jgi:hypothetical protein
MRTNFSNSLGAVDGKHVRICTPNDSGFLFLISRNLFSMVIIAFADAASSSVVYVEKIWVHQMTATFFIFEICYKKVKYIT